MHDYQQNQRVSIISESSTLFDSSDTTPILTPTPSSACAAETVTHSSVDDVIGAVPYSEHPMRHKPVSSNAAVTSSLPVPITDSRKRHTRNIQHKVFDVTSVPGATSSTSLLITSPPGHATRVAPPHTDLSSMRDRHTTVSTSSSAFQYRHPRPGDTFRSTTSGNITSVLRTDRQHDPSDTPEPPNRRSLQSIQTTV